MKLIIPQINYNNFFVNIYNPNRILYPDETLFHKHQATLRTGFDVVKRVELFQQYHLPGLPEVSRLYGIQIHTS